mmetsp:Transcript_26366/g.48160  ORF Transcript_26366/g.48160 Transcript_26366/m.48160 type:complete len:173 (-) Transcript_26366:211-729(-)
MGAPHQKGSQQLSTGKATMMSAAADEHGAITGDADGEDDWVEEEDNDESDNEVPLYGSEAEKRKDGEDSEPDTVIVSLFGPETFPSARACWQHAEQVHGFSLAKLRALFGADGWTDYHRIRLVNYLRKVGPDAAAEEAQRLSAESSIWSDDALLTPVFADGDDGLLFEDEDD